MNNNRFNAILESKDDIIASLKKQLELKEQIIGVQKGTIDIRGEIIKNLKKRLNMKVMATCQHEPELEYKGVKLLWMGGEA